MVTIKIFSLLEQVILYLVARLTGKRILVGRTRIMKLLYLADLVAKYRLGKTITGSRYYYYFFGPYSDEVQKAIISLTAKGVLQDNPVLTNAGQAHDYKVKVQDLPKLPLTKKEKAILDEIISKFGRRKLEEIIKTAYQTPPMKTAQPYQSILT